MLVIFLLESKRCSNTFGWLYGRFSDCIKFRIISGKYYAQHLSENESGKLDILVGAFMIMKRKLYLEIGGFDENCFMYSDDIDLSIWFENRKIELFS